MILSLLPKNSKIRKENMLSELKELETLVPDSNVVNIKGQEIEIKPFKFFNLLRVLRIILRASEDVSFTTTDEFTIIKLLSENPEALVEIFSIATGKNRDFFEDLDTDEGVELVTKIYKTNESFFIQKVQPKLESLGLNRSELQTDLKESQMIESEQKTQLEEEIPMTITLEE